MLQSLRPYVNISSLSGIRIGGRGGKEAILGKILPKWDRVGAPLYDYEFSTGGNFGRLAKKEVLRIEIKKQKDLQWFDIGKYYQIKKEDRNIWILFVMESKEGCGGPSP